MKKYIFYLILVLLSLSSCKQKNIPKEQFVTICDNHFELHDEPFFPMMLNYVVEYYNDGGDFIIGPSIDYDSVDYYESMNKETIEKQLNGHFNLIKEMGFSTIRVCFDRMQCDEDGHFYYSANQPFYIHKKKDVEAVLKGLDLFLACAEKHDLRIMLLLKAPLENASIEKFTIELLKHCQDNPTLFAYDFFNEPLYFDPNWSRTKADAQKICKRWQKMMHKYAPCQLFTIGFSEPIEVFEWDPTMLPVDFIEIHTYHPLRVCNEVYWYATHANKPWMIGETGLPADNDSISYDDQRIFLCELFQYVKDAGAAGFGWWQFQDAKSDAFEAAYTGLLNHTGTTVTAQGDTISGTLKPAGHLFHSLLNNYQKKEILRPANYYNMLGYNNLKICGTIVDQDGRTAIEGACIRGWNDDWSIGMNTYSDENGHFTLYCNQPCNHFEISAPSMSKVKFDHTVKFSPPILNPLPNMDIEYHSINYRHFIKTDCIGKSVFDFDPSLFNKAKHEGDIGTVCLKRIN